MKNSRAILSVKRVDVIRFQPTEQTIFRIEIPGANSPMGDGAVARKTA